MILIGDLHFDSSTNYIISSEDGYQDLILETAYKSLVYICDNYVDDGESVVFLGDIFEKKDRVLNVVKSKFIKAINMFKKKGCSLYFLVGNHDINKEGYLTISFLSKYYGKVFRKIVPVQIDGVDVLFLPYCRRNDFVLKELGKYRNKGYILMSHIGLDGMDLGGVIHEGDDLFKLEDFDGFSLVINGHYHFYRIFKDKVYCVGSLYKTDWGDMGNKYCFKYEKGKLVKCEIPDFLGRKVIKIESVEDVENIKNVDLCDNVVRFDIIVDGVMRNEVVEILKRVSTKLSFYNFVVKDLEKRVNDIGGKKVVSLETFINDELGRLPKDFDKELYKNIIYEVIGYGD